MIRYKTTTLNGKPISTHRKIWILHHGAIPFGGHIHHKNGNRFDNRIENLELISGSEHTRLHGIGRKPWNKGTAYGKTKAYKKSHKSRLKNYSLFCDHVLSLKKKGVKVSDIAKEVGRCSRQIYSILKGVI